MYFISFTMGTVWCVYFIKKIDVSFIAEDLPPCSLECVDVFWRDDAMGRPLHSTFASSHVGNFFYHNRQLCVCTGGTADHLQCYTTGLTLFYV